jgi:hypothetical protein
VVKTKGGLKKVITTRVIQLTRTLLVKVKPAGKKNGRALSAIQVVRDVGANPEPASFAQQQLANKLYASPNLTACVLTDLLDLWTVPEKGDDDVR